MSIKRLGRQRGNDYPAGLNLAKYGNYQVTKSLRFRSSASTYLSRSQTAGNSQKWTWSGWVKRGKLGTAGLALFGTIVYPTPSNYQSYFYFNSDDTFEVFFYTGSTVDGKLTTTQVFRDPSAWYHIMVSVDTTLATADNRMRVYVNGSEITAFTNRTNPSQNYNTYINNSASSGVGLGAVYPYTANYFDGYMAEVNFVDGQQLTPSSFGATDPTTGIWQPVAYTGTYGTNGFYLPFTDTTSLFTLGNDAGNGNNWTLNNFSLTAGATYDSMTDVPTLTSATAANYCTLNPLKRNVCTISNGNLTAAGPSQYTKSVTSTMSMPPGSGKFYWEVVFTRTSTSDGGVMPGIVSKTWSPGEATGSPSVYPGNSSDSWGVNGNDGSKINNSTPTSYGSSFASGDVIMLAYDAINGSFFVGKNGTWFDNGDPATNTRSAYTGITTEVIPAFGVAYDSGSSIANVNFGQRAFSYTPPTGFNTLCTYNLPDPTIKVGSQHFDATTYTGTGAARAITNAGNFQPDFVWCKARGGAGYGHQLYDSVRGATNYVHSNSTAAEATDTTGVTAFNSNGFSLGTSAWINESSMANIAWNWKAGGTAVTNSNGTITSQVSVNPTAGFSIVKWASSSYSDTIGHGLGSAPAFILAKELSTTRNWMVYHQSLGNSYYLSLNTTGAAATPNAGRLEVSGANNFICGTDGTNQVAYCWTAISGYSAFSTYTGNGSYDGPFVYTGFKPKFVMLKMTSSTNPWHMYDTSRDSYNYAYHILTASSSGAEDSSSGAGVAIDLLSNGFKIRTDWVDINTSGGTYIYAAFAEYPFKNGNAAIYNIN